MDVDAHAMLGVVIWGQYDLVDHPRQCFVRALNHRRISQHVLEPTHLVCVGLGEIRKRDDGRRLRGNLGELFLNGAKLDIALLEPGPQSAGVADAVLHLIEQPADPRRHLRVPPAQSCVVGAGGRSAGGKLLGDARDK
ncbi:MAG: hypothetical protein COY86_01970, partial [Rhodobacterales bacterium CG_4_10_14_0_8_um_filter_70_9]